MMHHRRTFALLAALPLLGATGGCGGPDEARAEADLALLRSEVAELRARAAGGTDGGVATDATASGVDDAITVALRLTMVRDVLAGAAERYLGDVRLHLRPDVVVRTGNEVRVRAGPLSVTAGRWDLAVTIQRIDARLEAGRIDLAAGDEDRLDLTVPVHIRSATGDALIDFTWNAARLAGVVCSSFAVNETFAGVVRPRTEVLRGHFELVLDDGLLIARPALRDRISVSPIPTEESWVRIREILREQNRIFNCGLALSPDNVEEMLRDLLTRGFRFDLPASILRAVPLPGSIINEVDVRGRAVTFEVIPAPPQLSEHWLRLHATVRAVAGDDVPIPIGGS